VANFRKQLLVEGKDDQHVVWALCEKFTITESFEVIDCTGIEKLLEQTPVRFKQSGIETIGIIVDADTDINARWNSLKNIMSAQGFVIPEEIPAEGLVLHNGDNKTVGIWIMPDNNLNGMLEDFIAFLVPDSDQLLPVTDVTLAEIETNQLNKYRSVHKAKARIHTWLAWQENPGTPLGLSITNRYLTTEAEVCNRFINWLNKLFNPAETNL
jgi:hypothetical protein